MSGFHVGPPRLVSFSCHVREPDSSAAACQLNLVVEDPDEKPLVGGRAVKTVAIELQPATLATLLDGLGRIRDQLSSVASRKH